MSTTADTGVHWQRKQAALRDLIMRMLCSEGDVISESSEGVPAQIRRYYSLPNGDKTLNSCISEVLGLMEQAQLITRDMNSARTRTTRIKLVGKMDPTQAIKLEFHRTSNLAVVLNMEPGADAPEKVLEEVYSGYEAMQRAAREADIRESDERVAINAAEVLEDADLPGRRDRRVRYYLRKLGLIKADRNGQYDHPPLKLWWWTISTDAIDELRLMALIVGEDNFETWAAEDARRKAARREKAGAAPVVSSDSGGDPVTTRPAPKPGPPLGRRAAPMAKAPVTIEVNEDPTVTMAGIIEQLERQLETLRAEHKAALAQKDEVHAAALKEKDDEIARLQQQLRSRPALDPRAAAAIARHTQDGSVS